MNKMTTTNPNADFTDQHELKATLHMIVLGLVILAATTLFWFLAA